MNKFFLPVLLALTVLITSAPKPVHAESFATKHERRIFYQFNEKRRDPAKTDERLKEVIYEGLVLWVGKPRKGKPTVMYLPGSGGNLYTRGHKFRWFLNKGYGVVAMAYPGMAGSKGQPSRQKIQNLANQLYRDIPKLTGSKQIILMGESLGTGVAVAIAAGKPGRANPPSALILQAPYTSLVDLTASKNPALLPFVAGRTDLWPSKRAIQSVKVPTFIMHGQKDGTVPYRMGERLYQLSPAKNKVLATRKRAGHTSIWQKNVLSPLNEWLQAIHRK
ncbi:2-hydroxy-6-oxononadienedioate/2-hydroxy-6-oxononatrienedioate hydrolase [Aliiroseovarius pelagivivens]|uniref:2-hydroxy-6-oxononadienedioate/2-hydroxy-6-oxononatrienedioate hydrolase n=1 Tax=Aliiroseovarius pelagivivens TaxID=1639690 RepID=A0A2R8AI17_9RHOB|nr:alpha/beta hydrolase [Aliiroseovarius pelagivivens]SPF75670.1 2-hydroxy-6-oxononadienedioate/2-hydroxy-6-oxononatrienedioate hydrolase [Aliiroseovarius pelagivivens]